jgi:hypothetical protein
MRHFNVAGCKGLAVALTVAFFGVGGCRGKPGAHPRPQDAIDACNKALDAIGDKPNGYDIRRAVDSCSTLFSEPTCRHAWKTFEVGSANSWIKAERTCLCAYCPKIASKELAYCKRYCPATKRMTLEERIGAIRHARKLWEEIRHYEYGTRCGDHQLAFELMAKLYGLSIWVGFPSLEDPVELEPVKLPGKRPSLELALVMTDQGFYLKSRHGAECPEGVSADAKLCFPKKEGKYTDYVLKQLQHHLWYLFGSKYKDPDSYASPAERHSITLIPEPTIKYDDIVRTLDIIREIPRDAKYPPVKHDIPASGCAMKRDPKTKRYSFIEVGGESVRDTACMYFRVTLALGSS